MPQTWTRRSHKVALQITSPDQVKVMFHKLSSYLRRGSSAKEGGKLEDWKVELLATVNANLALQLKSRIKKSKISRQNSQSRISFSHMLRRVWEILPIQPCSRMKTSYLVPSSVRRKPGASSGSMIPGSTQARIILRMQRKPEEMEMLSLHAVFWKLLSQPARFDRSLKDSMVGCFLLLSCMPTVSTTNLFSNWIL